MNTWSVLWCCEKVFTSSQHYSTVIHKKTTNRSKTDPVNEKMYQGETRSRCGNQACDDNNDTNSRENPPLMQKNPAQKEMFVATLNNISSYLGVTWMLQTLQLNHIFKATPIIRTTSTFILGTLECCYFSLISPDGCTPISQRSTKNQSTTQETDLSTHFQKKKHYAKGCSSS